MGIGKIPAARHGAAKEFDGLWYLPPVFEHVAEIVARLRVVGLELERPPVGLERFFQSSLLREGDAETVLGVHVIGPQG